jgi:hypothetical protein
LREEKYEFQFFLFLIIPAKSAVEVRKECIDDIPSLISENLRRDIVVLIPTRVKV